MRSIILRMGTYMKADDFDEYKAKWEEENPDTLLIPYTMKVERTKGKWIFKGNHFSGAQMYECTICHYGWISYDCFNYCPRCGAEMEAEE